MPTKTSRELFWDAYQRTLVAGGWTLDEAHMEECWRQVQGFPASLYEAAATLLNGSCHFLPRPAEWRQACDQASAAEDRAAREALERTWEHETERPRTYACPTCEDTGFEPQFCQPGQLCTSCPRGPHLYDHPYRIRCACWRTNPVIQRRRLRQQELAQVGPREARSVEARLRKGAREWQQAAGAEA
jgi:hypothetical protein